MQANNQQLQKDAEEAATSVEPLKLKRSEHTKYDSFSHHVSCH